MLYCYCINTNCMALEGRKDIFNISNISLHFLSFFFIGTHVLTLLIVISRHTQLLPSWACLEKKAKSVINDLLSVNKNLVGTYTYQKRRTFMRPILLMNEA